MSSGSVGHGERVTMQTESLRPYRESAKPNDRVGGLLSRPTTPHSLQQISPLPQRRTKTSQERGIARKRETNCLAMRHSLLNLQKTETAYLFSSRHVGYYITLALRRIRKRTTGVYEDCGLIRATRPSHTCMALHQTLRSADLLQPEIR